MRGATTSLVWLALLLAACPAEEPPDCDQDRDGFEAEGDCGGDDCDDLDPRVHPGAAELCDPLDRDCDGSWDGGAEDGTTFWTDLDGDGFGDPLTAATACNQWEGLVANDADCDDSDPEIRPGAVEVCNARDDDCDGYKDDVGLWLDPDGDGFGSGPPTPDCRWGLQWAQVPGDCDETDPAVHPGAPEVCGNGVDDDCDGLSVGCGVEGSGAALHLADLVVDREGWYLPRGLAIARATALDGPLQLLIGAWDPPEWRVLVVDGDLGGTAHLDESSSLVAGWGVEDFTMVTVVALGDTGGAAGPDLGVGVANEAWVFDLPLATGSTVDAARVSVPGGDGREEPALASADLDGDGVHDLLVGQHWWSGERGRVLVFLGPVEGELAAEDADARIHGDAGSISLPEAGGLTDLGDRLGIALVDLGDADGDGLGEFAVGAPGWNRGSLAEGGVDSGAAFVFSWPLAGVVGTDQAIATLPGSTGHGSVTWSSSDDWCCRDDDDSVAPDPYWDEVPSFAGRSLAVGDTDGDGGLELIVASQAGLAVAFWQNGRRSLLVDVFPGPWLGDIEAATARTSLEVTRRHPWETHDRPYWFRNGILAADIDADGRDDLAVVAEKGPGGGPFWLVRGPLPSGPGMIEASAAAVLWGGEHLSLHAGPIAASDLDGDGFDDLAIGASGYPTEDRVFVLRGGPGL